MMLDSSNVILPPGSPVSPKSVMATFDEQEGRTKDSKKMDHLAKACPLPRRQPEIAKTAEPEIVTAVVDDGSPKAVQGSTPFYGLYTLRPNENSILAPIMRTVLPLDARVAAHVSETVMDDILLHQLQFQRDDLSHNVFSGRVNGGHRLVLARMGNDQYGVACSEEEHAEQFRFFLQACDVQVQKLQI